MTIDFGRTADDYATYRAGFPPKLLDRLAGFGLGLPGQEVLDLGTGTGTLARQLAARGARVSALDPSPKLLAEATRLSEAAGLKIAFREGRAEAPPFDDAAFDLVIAGQCWHWFDRAAAAAASRRVLRPGGRLVIAHFDWLPLPGNVVAATERLIEEHNPKWFMGGGAGIYPAWFADLSAAGFEDLESFSFDETVAYDHAGWRGRIRASAGVGASLSSEAAERFDSALERLLESDFSQQPLAVPHRCWALIGRAKPAPTPPVAGAEG